MNSAPSSAPWRSCGRPTRRHPGERDREHHRDARDVEVGLADRGAGVGQVAAEEGAANPRDDRDGADHVFASSSAMARSRFRYTGTQNDIPPTANVYAA